MNTKLNFTLVVLHMTPRLWSKTYIKNLYLFVGHFSYCLFM